MPQLAYVVILHWFVVGLYHIQFPQDLEEIHICYPFPVEFCKLLDYHQNLTQQVMSRSLVISGRAVGLRLLRIRRPVTLLLGAPIAPAMHKRGLPVSLPTKHTLRVIVILHRNKCRLVVAHSVRLLAQQMIEILGFGSQVLGHFG